MRVVLLVTTETGRRRVRESSIFVTIEARGLKVLAEQWVIRRRMVELGLQPFCWLVARRAIRTHSVLMRLIVLVAADTGRWCFPTLQVRRMAAFTVGLLVRSR